MAIASFKPEAKLPSVTNQPKISSDFYKGTLVSDSDLPITTLLGYVEGAPWLVDDYFSQIISEHNDLKTIDTNVSSIFHQYTRIKDMEIRVSQPLSDSYEQETATSIVSGNGFLYNVIIPNKNDYFTATVGENKKALVRITSVERKTFNDESVFYIEYELAGFISKNSDIEKTYNKLLESSVRTYHYSKQRLINGLSPLLREDYHQKELNLESICSSMIKEYYELFYNRRYSTVIVPGQDYPIYDKYIVDFMNKIINTDETDLARRCRLHSSDGDNFYNQRNILDLLLERKSLNMRHINNYMCLVPKQFFLRNSYSKSLAFNSVTHYVYPYITDDSVYVTEQEKQIGPDITVNLKPTTNKNNISYSYYNDNFQDAVTNAIYVKPITVYSSYILSSDFYFDTENQSILEMLIKDYINARPISLDKLYMLITVYSDWNRLEQFYYIPLLIILIKNARMGFYE